MIHRLTTEREMVISDRLPGGLAALGLSIGVLVLIGWGLEIESLKRVGPGLTPMKVNTRARADRDRRRGSSRSPGVEGDGEPRSYRAWWRRRSGRSRFPNTSSGSTSGSIRSGSASEADQGATHPGRMHPATALDLVFLGLAVSLLGLDRLHRIADSLALLVGSIAGATLIGYLYGVRKFVGLAAYQQMAIHTGATFLILSSRRPPLATIAGGCWERS